MTHQVHTPQADANYVEVFTCDRDGAVFGYRLVGASAGPQVAVLGSCAAAELAFDRLMNIPTLPWMRGNLVLIQIDALDDSFSQIDALESLGTVDRTITLPQASAVVPTEAEVRQYYQSVLRVCADLGMISGRGLSRNGSRDEAA